MSKLYILNWAEIKDNNEKLSLGETLMSLIKSHDTYSTYSLSKFNPKYVNNYKTFYLLTNYHGEGANHVGWSIDPTNHFSGCEMVSIQRMMDIITTKIRKCRKTFLSFKMNVIESPINIKPITPIKYLAVYGTLRKYSKRGYNFNRFGVQTYIDDIKLHPYVMFNLGNYPAIISVDKAGDAGKNVHPIIQGELHAVSIEAFNKIREMELGAGYSETQIMWGKLKVALFVADSIDMLKNATVIEGGTWN